MSQVIVTPHRPTVKHAPRFIPAQTEADKRAQYMRDYDAGYALYQADRRLPHNASAGMTDGWTDALNAGAGAYWQAMQQQASAYKAVNWNS